MPWFMTSNVKNDEAVGFISSLQDRGSHGTESTMFYLGISNSLVKGKKPIPMSKWELLVIRLRIGKSEF